MSSRASSAGTGVRRLFLSEFARVAALTVLPVLLFAVVVCAVLTVQERRAVLDSLRSQAREAALDLDRLFQRQFTVLHTLAGSRALDIGDLQAFYVEAQRAVGAQSDWYTIALSEPASGMQILNLQHPMGTSLPTYGNADERNQVARTQRPVISADLAAAATAGRPVLRLLYPVIRDSEVLYILSSGLRAESVARTISRLDLPEGHIAGIADRKGVIMTRTSAGGNRSGQTVIPAVAKMLEERRSGLIEARTSQGVMAYVAVGYAPLSGWIVGISVPTRVVNRLWQRELWIIGLGGIVSAAAALASLAWITRRRRGLQRVLEQRVSERTAALEKALAERGLLLREVYHRVKNNLQVIDGLLRLEAMRLPAAESRNVLDRLRDRVQALGLVHQQLMQSSDLSTFDIEPFVEELLLNIGDGAVARQRGVRIDARAASLCCTLDFAVPLGLLTTELVGYALRGGFPDGEGRIVVSVSVDGASRTVLTVGHNGTADFRQLAQSQDVSARIVRALIQQLEVQDSDMESPQSVRIAMPRPEAA